jgi:large subunit ribosomal protein L18
MRNKQRNIQNSRARRVIRVRSRVKGTSVRPRLAVNRTLRSISAQIIDDAKGATLVSASERDLAAAAKKGKKPVEIAAEVGKALAKKAVAAKVVKVVFDRRDNALKHSPKARAKEDLHFKRPYDGRKDTTAS